MEDYQNVHSLAYKSRGMHWALRSMSMEVAMHYEMQAVLLILACLSILIRADQGRPLCGNQGWRLEPGGAAICPVEWVSSLWWWPHPLSLSAHSGRGSLVPWSHLTGYGFINVDYFLMGNLQPPITLQKTQSVVTTPESLTTSIWWQSALFGA